MGQAVVDDNYRESEMATRRYSRLPGRPGQPTNLTRAGTWEDSAARRAPRPVSGRCEATPRAPWAQFPAQHQKCQPTTLPHQPLLTLPPPPAPPRAPDPKPSRGAPPDHTKATRTRAPPPPLAATASSRGRCSSSAPSRPPHSARTSTGLGASSMAKRSTGSTSMATATATTTTTVAKTPNPRCETSAGAGAATPPPKHETRPRTLRAPSGGRTTRTGARRGRKSQAWIVGCARDPLSAAGRGTGTRNTTTSPWRIGTDRRQLVGTGRPKRSGGSGCTIRRRRGGGTTMTRPCRDRWLCTGGARGRGRGRDPSLGLGLGRGGRRLMAMGGGGRGSRVGIIDDISSEAAGKSCRV
ncbi:hypothetical protein B0H67DRAFT_353485 [Lasiosphaeris hirsuta]|uniref:Uncharacterized protein n=1 Tax=Lasiosphaeris hirsuta TaxID=260670 RepID=A0AA39ZVV2_9PEZI|nr:hypothetical protein B0H67DRAFT_353485 [Lasiosphaeris hirsuta]